MNRILVVDDEPQILHLLRDLLEQNGYQVEEAANGEEALKLNQKHIFDLVVTDIIMPGKEGIQTIQELRKKNTRLKIIAISGGGHSASTVYLDMAEKMGANMTIAKPFDLNLFLNMVKSLLND
ncbi:MAG TPA: response regulator [bacterium]|nr:response regulator [bacterium]HPN42093.1 response regulator [bacterium]